MHSEPHLLMEDRPEFERILDEVLRTANDRPELAAIGRQLKAEQLRTMALGAAATIAANVDVEYQRFVLLREELRRPSHAPSSAQPSPDGTRGDSSDRLDGTSGAGVAAIVTVLAPLLAGAAAAIFLAVGYLLHLVDPEPSMAGPLRTAGWAFAALAGAGILIASAGLLTTALRNGARGRTDGARGDRLTEQVSQARVAWHTALRDHGILPFLQEALANPATTSPAVPQQTSPSSRTPHLGYSRPGFTSPTNRDGRTLDSPAEASRRPRFSSPDFSSPDYGGPEHRPE